MSNEKITQKAKEYLKAGLSVLPTDISKKPCLETWNHLKKQRYTEEEVDTFFTSSQVTGLGIITGAISGSLEVIDVDCKYDITGSLWEDVITLIKDNLPELYSKLVIAKTVNNGYHIYYRCSIISGSLKLSNRPSIETDKKETYLKEIKNGATEEEAQTRAKNDKIKVLVETRGEGGYIIAPPSPGYEYLQGEPNNIPEITPEEREIIIQIGRSFNEVEIRLPAVKKNYTVSSTPGNSPFEDYNNRGDVLTLLESKGWRIINELGPRVYLLRPGVTDSKTSGNYHTEKKIFYVFSSSTEFTPEQGYNPSQVFSLLECNGDNKIAYRKLLALGYGEPYRVEDTRPKILETKQIKVETVNTVNRVTSVISNPGEALKIENIKTAGAEEIIITSPGEEAQDEVIKAIELLQPTANKIYIIEGGVEVREYRYYLLYLFNKYGNIQEAQGELTDRDKHNFLEEIIIHSSRLQPIDRDIFKKDFLSREAIIELGISEESLSMASDKLTSNNEREAQANDLKQLLKTAIEHQERGDINTALELLETRVKDVKLKDKATEFSKLLLSIKEEELKKRQREKPESIPSGYKIEGEDILLPAGAISVITAPTTHGKTTFLLNLALNVVKTITEKETYFFTLEEDADSVLISALNIYTDTKLNSYNKRAIENYFRTESDIAIIEKTRGIFHNKKKQFFEEVIDSKKLNIHYFSDNSDVLIEAIRYLKKHANPGAIFIDYIQLLNLPEGKYKTYSRQEEMKVICTNLKDIAIETGLPIIVGAQLNREVTNPLRINSTRIGEAGDIERIANLIIGLWNTNGEMIATAGERELINKKGADYPNSIYSIVLKNRLGKIGLEEVLTFEGNKGQIKNRIIDYSNNK